MTEACTLSAAADMVAAKEAEITRLREKLETAIGALQEIVDRARDTTVLEVAIASDALSSIKGEPT